MNYNPDTDRAGSAFVPFMSRPSEQHKQGSEKSGNFGHAGRPHEVGGSGPGGDKAERISRSLMSHAAKIEPAAKSTILNTTNHIDHGTSLIGTEHSLKTHDSMMLKVNNYIRDNPAATAADIQNLMKDNCRFTMLAPEDDYTLSVNSALDDLESQGYAVERARNYWDDDVSGGTFKGVTTVLTSPGGFPVELQFHTQASWDAEAAAHTFYKNVKESNDPQVMSSLNEKLVTYFKDVPTPKGAAEIKGRGFQKLWAAS